MSAPTWVSEILKLVREVIGLFSGGGRKSASVPYGEIEKSRDEVDKALEEKHRGDDDAAGDSRR